MKRLIGISPARPVNRLSEYRGFGVILCALFLLPCICFFYILLRFPVTLIDFGFLLTKILSDSGDFEQHNRPIRTSFVLHVQNPGAPTN